MGALDGSLKTPFGEVSKKTAAIVGGGAVVILGIVWFRSKKQADSAAALAATGVPTDINPATGFVYGSPEDAAALANQAQFNFPPSGGGGSGGGGSGSTGFTTNAEWAQAATQYMVDHGIVVDSSQLSAALGAYISGQPVTGAQKSLIEQAIAYEGKPPLAGATGYPPSINTAPVVTLTAPSGLRQTSQTRGWINLSWNSVPNATGYRVFGTRNSTHTQDVLGTAMGWKITDPSVDTFTFQVAALSGTTVGPKSAILSVKYTSK